MKEVTATTFGEESLRKLFLLDAFKQGKENSWKGEVNFIQIKNNNENNNDDDGNGDEKNLEKEVKLKLKLKQQQYLLSLVCFVSWCFCLRNLPSSKPARLLACWLTRLNFAALLT